MRVMYERKQLVSVLQRGKLLNKRNESVGTRKHMLKLILVYFDPKG